MSEGLQTGANEVFIFNKKPYFYYDLSQNEKNLFKPFYKNSNINKYQIKNSEKLILYFRSDYKIENYPNIKNYLVENIDTLENRAQIKRSKQSWYGLLWPRDEKMFMNKAIVVPYRSQNVSFSISNGNFYSGTDTYFITKLSKDFSYEMLLGILNSKLAFLWFRNKGKVKGNVLDMTGDNIEQIPIPLLDTPEKCEIAGQIEVLVEKILEMKTEAEKSHLKRGCEPSERGVSELKHLPPTKLTPSSQEGQNTTSLETQIDKLVFELYGLSEEEMAVVENQTRQI